MGILNWLKEKVTNNSVTINNGVIDRSIGNITIPYDVFELLWFKDGVYKNYVPGAPYKECYEAGGIKLEISFQNSDEPSAISMKLPIKHPKDINKVKELEYFPSYNELSAEQRWVYLNWLTNVDKNIETGYVFIFYYGLERQLFFNKSEEAFNMIMRLRKNHRNKSFLNYSFDALIASCIIHNNVQGLEQLINSVKDEDVKVNDLYLLTKRTIGRNLNAKEIMNISTKIGFKNRRYISDESIMFEQQLRFILEEKYMMEELPLGIYEINNIPKVDVTISCNYSLSDGQRFISIPSLFNSKAFVKDVFAILQEAHNRVKEILRESRNAKNNDKVPVQAVIPQKNEVKHKVDKMYEQSILFEAIDVHQFDKNVEYYDTAVCPYCDRSLNKRPVTKMKCPSCGNDVLVKKSIFTGQKVMLTKEEYEKMVQIKDDKTNRRFIYNMLAGIQVEPEEFALKLKNSNKTMEELLLELYYNRAREEFKKANLGIYRCFIMNIGQIYEHTKQFDVALDMYLLVCYYDLRGCMNGSFEFEQVDSSLAPALIKWILKIQKKLKIDERELKDKYSAIVQKMVQVNNVQNSIEYTWKELENGLNDVNK